MIERRCFKDGVRLSGVQPFVYTGQAREAAGTTANRTICVGTKFRSMKAGDVRSVERNAVGVCMPTTAARCYTCHAALYSVLVPEFIGFQNKQPHQRLANIPEPQESYSVLFHGLPQDLRQRLYCP